MIDTTWDTLKDLVNRVEYKPGWRVYLVDDKYEPSYLKLEILAKGYDSYHTERGDTYRVIHSFIVPAASYNEQSWMRWLLDRYIEVETHEACEFFTLRSSEQAEQRDGICKSRPFAPNHGPGWNPYGVRELNRVEHAETSSSGVHKAGSQ